MAPASEDEEPPNLVKSTEAETDDAEQAATAGVVVRGRLVVDDVGVADGDPPEQAESTPRVARAATEVARTTVRRGGIVGAGRLMTT
jgi:hypothetical protein